MADDKKSLSRRRLLRFSAAAGVTAILGEPVSFAGTQQSGPRTPVPAAAEELVLMNGKIHTMDRNNTVVQTVSIKNGRFSTVGGAVPRKGPGIRIIDLRGRTVVPGIIDNHNHVVLMGTGPVITPRSRTPTRFAKCRKLWQLARREFPVAHGSRRLEDSTAIICFGLTRLHVCPRLRSLMRLRRTIPCTSRRDSPVLRRRTVG